MLRSHCTFSFGASNWTLWNILRSYGKIYLQILVILACDKCLLCIIFCVTGAYVKAEADIEDWKYFKANISKIIFTLTANK